MLNILKETKLYLYYNLQGAVREKYNNIGTMFAGLWNQRHYFFPPLYSTFCIFKHFCNEINRGRKLKSCKEHLSIHAP